MDNRYDRAVVPSQCLVGEAQDLETLPASNVEHLRTRYDTILTEAEAGHPPRPRRPGTHGRVKQSPACYLIRRLRKHRNEVLRFLTDRRIPFDNNQAKRDLRMPKLKQKVSGCFRSETGGDAFAIIRSYLVDPPQTVRRSFQPARPDVPRATPNAPIGVTE